MSIDPIENELDVNLNIENVTEDEVVGSKLLRQTSGLHGGMI